MALSIVCICRRLFEDHMDFCEMYLEIPQVAKCCFGASLVTGSKIIAGYTMLCGSLISSIVIFEMASSKREASTIELPISYKLDLIYYYIGLNFLLLVGISHIVSAFLLLYAIVKDRYSFVYPYFGVILTVQLVDVVGFVFFFIKLFTDPGLSCLFLFCIAINTAVTLYCFIVVYSYYRDVTWSSVT